MKKYSFQVGITLLQLRDIARYGRCAAVSGRDNSIILTIILYLKNRTLKKKKTYFLHKSNAKCVRTRAVDVPRADLC